MSEQPLIDGKTRMTLDVRDDIRNGREPFAKISGAVAQLEVGQDLLLIAPFKPAPLFHVLAKQGFQHNARQTASGDWEVLFTRGGEKPVSVEAASRVVRGGPVCPESDAGKTVEIDARGLEPPQPMVNILEALTSLPAGAQLAARTDRRPVHLYPMLEERGFAALTEEQSDGSFITRIRLG
jgi:uncharacterized protein (DUF2249 family)